MKSDITGRVSITIDAPANEVWDALTKPDQIKKYFFGTNTVTDWKVGSPVKFKGKWEGKEYEDKGTVLANEPKRLLKYTYWSSIAGIEDKPENYANITYELSEKNGHTTVTIIQENIPDEKMKAHSQENWNKVIKNLKQYVEEGVETYA
jgi:uncharacterized protein YndB with AHSA1/START domain